MTVNLTQATLAGQVSDCVGQISEGSWRAAGEAAQAHAQDCMALPWHMDRPFSLNLHFRLGGTLFIQAQGASCVVDDDARFFESHAC